jgi:Flp pilus assembly CpaF family ATPase
LISMHSDSPKQIEPLIGEAVQCVIHIARTQEGRRIAEIVELLGYEDGKYITQTVGV